MSSTCYAPGSVLEAGETTVAEIPGGEKDALAENCGTHRSQAQPSQAAQGGHRYLCQGGFLVWVTPHDGSGAGYEGV